MNRHACLSPATGRDSETNGRKRASVGPLTTGALRGGLGGLLAAHPAGDQHSTAAEEDENEAEARTDARVTPVETACRALIPKERSDQAPRSLRIFAGEWATEPVWLVRICRRAMVALGERGVVRRRAEHMVIGCLHRRHRIVAWIDSRPCLLAHIGLGDRGGDRPAGYPEGAAP